MVIIPSRPQVTCDGLTITVSQKEERYCSIFRGGCWWLEFPIRLHAKIQGSGNAETEDSFNLLNSARKKYTLCYRICESEITKAVDKAQELTELSFSSMGLEKLDLTFTQFVDQWIEDHEHIWKSPSSAINYRKASELVIKPFFRRENREVALRHTDDDIDQIENIWKETIEEWQEWAEKPPVLTPDYLVRYACYLMGFALESLYQARYYHYDLSRHLHQHRKPVHHHIVKDPIPEDVFNDVFTGCRSGHLHRQQIRYELVVLYVFALRKSEGPALRESNYCAADHTLKIDAQIKMVHGIPELVMGTKTGYNQRIVIAEGAEILFEAMRNDRKRQAEQNGQYCNPDVLLVTEDDGSCINPELIADALQEATDGHVTPHMLRAQSLTDIYEEKRKDPKFSTNDVGQNMLLLKAMARYARHQDPRTTCRYIHSDRAGLELLRENIAKDRVRFAEGNHGQL